MPRIAGWPSFAVALVLVVGVAQQAASQQTQRRDAERGRALLAVDFIAVGADGSPVLDLGAQDVSIKIAGRSRSVRSLQLVSAPAGDAEALPAPFGTNAVSVEGRSVVLILDNESFRPGRETPLREAVDAFIDGLAPADRLALVTMPYGGVKVPLTTEHTRVATALLQIVGGALQSESGSELACRSARTLESLLGYLQSLGYRDSPAIVVFVTAGLAAPRRDASLLRAPGMCELPVNLFRQVGAMAGISRAQFYIVQPVDLFKAGSVAREDIAGTNYGGSDNPIEGIENLQGVTGGKILALTGSEGGALARILRETTSHYVASVDPTDSDRTGRPMPLDVAVSRAGVEIRSRPQIAFPKPEGPAARAVNPSPRDMLSVTTVFRDLPLRASAFTSLDPDGKTLRVTAIAEAIEPGTKVTSLMAVLFGSDGKSVASWVATEPELARAPMLGAMNVGPGAYRLRVAAIDAAGRSGTADYDVNAEVVQTGPLKLSSLVLGLSREGAFVPRLEFSTEPVAIAFLELYGGTPGMSVSATLEISRTLNGPALLAVPLAISLSGDNRYVAKGAVPIASLPPGDYAVRAIVGIEGQPATRVVRTLRKRPSTSSGRPEPAEGR